MAGVTSPVKVDSPPFYVHWQLRAGARVSLPAEYPERAVYVASGEVEIDGERVEAGKMAVLVPGKAATIATRSGAVVMALGGEPVGPRYIDWNFVSSSPERLDQARADWAAGRMKLPDLDHDEFIPLPPKLGAKPDQAWIAEQRAKAMAGVHLWSKLNKYHSIDTVKGGDAGLTLESSAAGSLFDGLSFGMDYSTNKVLGQQWKMVSKTFVSQSTGVVHAQVLKGIDPSSVLFKTEWPEIRGLIEAGTVTHLVVHFFDFVGGGNGRPGRLRPRRRRSDRRPAAGGRRPSPAGVELRVAVLAADVLRAHFRPGDQHRPAQRQQRSGRQPGAGRRRERPERCVQPRLRRHHLR